MLKVNIGCGVEFSDDLIGIDMYDYGQQHVLDLEKETLPFDDDSVDWMKSNHALEHFRDVQLILNECWRVLKPGAEFEIKVPYGLWEGASKPVHHQIITECWFDFLRKEKTYIYGYKRWKLLKLERLNDGAEVFCRMTPDK